MEWHSIYFFQQRAQLINFDHDDIILKAGEAPKGIYIIVSGLVKVSTFISSDMLALVSLLHIFKYNTSVLILF